MSRHRSLTAHLPGIRGRGPVAAAIVLLTGLLVATLGPTPNAEATVDPGSIAGVVTDHTGAPLQGIKVEVIRSIGVSWNTAVVAHAKTDATGHYQVDDIEAYPYHHVRFTDPHAVYATEFYNDVVTEGLANWVPVTADTITQGADATLEPAASIAGQLTTLTGTPVPNGKVQLMWELGESGWGFGATDVTDETGLYTIDGIKPATYALEFADSASANPTSPGLWFWHDRPDISTADKLVVAAPVINGTARVGNTLSASAGSWAPNPTTVTYRWVVGADTAASDDPTGPLYVPIRADIGRRVRVVATLTYPGSVQVAASSMPTPAVLGQVASVVRPRVKGVLEVGHVVRVSHGVWKPSAVVLKYQWYARGKAITGATHRRLMLTGEFLGKRLTVRIKAKATGYLPKVVWTRSTARIAP